MHIPDGAIDAKTAAASGIVAVAGVIVALAQTKRTLPARKVPLLGLAAAFIFAVQMLNFPVLAGTSGHLVGGVLAAVLLGPGAAVVAMTCVLLVQCFLFSDGGVTALGANIFNIAVVGPLVGYAIYRLMRQFFAGVRGLIFASAFAAWCATVLTAICCAGQLAWSGKVAWAAVFPAMAGVHMLIGLGEGIITALVLVAVVRVRPELVNTDASARGATLQFVASGLIVTSGLVLFVAPFACPWPDGLEKVAAKLGLQLTAMEPPVMPSPIPDYVVPGIGSPVAATALAGLIGVVVVLALSWILARLLAPRTGG